MDISGVKVHSWISTFSLAKSATRSATRSASDVNHNLTDVTKVVFTRCPYMKIFSAFVDKVFPMSMPRINFKIFHDSHLANRSSNGSSPRDLYRKSSLSLLNISFSSTLLYAAGAYSDIRLVDPHFRSPSSFCDVCHVNYDVIGKVETFNDDVEYFLKFINQTKVFESMGDVDSNNEKRTITDVVFRTFKDFRLMKTSGKRRTRGIYSCRFSDAILRRVWKLFQIRGYLSDSVPFPLKDQGESCSIHESQFLTLAMKALARSGSREKRKSQRHKYFLQAFRSVPLDVLHRYRESVQRDCHLFGYDCNPPDIFQGRRPGDEEENIFSDIKYLFREKIRTIQ